MDIHSTWKKRGSLPLKVPFLDRLCALSPFACVSALISELFIPVLGKRALRAPWELRLLGAHCSPSGCCRPSLSKHPWSSKARGSWWAPLLTETVNDELLACDTTEMFHIPAFDAFRTSAERHGIFRHGVKGIWWARKRTEKCNVDV